MKAARSHAAFAEPVGTVQLHLLQMVSQTLHCRRKETKS